MSVLAIIGGTGLTSLAGLEVTRREVVSTPWGEPSGAITHGRLHGTEIAFLARHGYGHTIAPHRINYRANIWALGHIGVREIIAVAAVGGIAAELAPGRLAIPEQIVDYTWGRGHTFFENGDSPVVHVDFTRPYSQPLRERLARAGRAAGIECIEGGTYGATQGPRLESAAEIDRLEGDGCTMVGMTGMPEAGLARELGLEYAHCAVCANRAAGRGAEPIRGADIEANLEAGMAALHALLAHLVVG